MRPSLVLCPLSPAFGGPWPAHSVTNSTHDYSRAGSQVSFALNALQANTCTPDDIPTSDSLCTRGVKEAWKEAPEASRFPFQARRARKAGSPGRSCPAEDSPGQVPRTPPVAGGWALLGRPPGEAKPRLLLPWGPPSLPLRGRRPGARAQESATGTRAQRRRRTAERETRTLSSSHFRRLTGRARGDATKSREIYSPKRSSPSTGLAPPSRRLRSCSAPAPVTPLGRPLLAISDARAPPPRSRLVFVGKQLLGLESKSGWSGRGPVLLGDCA